MRRTTAGLAGLLLLAGASATAAPAQAAESTVTRVDCRSLYGSGSYANPVRLGTIRGTLIAAGCPPLTSGAGYNNRYFLFSTTRTAGRGSVAGAAFRLSGNQSAVHPRLASGAVTIMRSSQGFWTGDSPDFTGRYLPIQGLYAGTYRLGMEKLRSPLSSLSTPWFDVVVVIR